MEFEYYGNLKTKAFMCGCKRMYIFLAINVMKKVILNSFWHLIVRWTLSSCDRFFAANVPLAD